MDEHVKRPSLLVRASESAWWRFFALAFLWTAIGALFALQVMVFDELPGYVSFRMALMDWGPWILLSPIVLWFSARVQINGTSWRWALPLHCVACIVITALLEIGAFFVFSSGFKPREEPMGPPPPSGEQFESGGRTDRGEQGPRSDGDMEMRGGRKMRPMMHLVHARFHVPIYWMLVAAIHALAFHKRSLERERRMVQAEALLTEARLAALQSQIRPHFLFNTLNTIAQKVQEDPSGAEQMIVSLSEMLRVVLAASEKREVSLREELAFIDLYLGIQQTRFADRLHVEREVDNTLLESKVPTLLLQPLVENAVIHGIAKNPNPGRLCIRVSLKSPKSLLVEISDSGPGSSLRDLGSLKSDHEGVGLRNTRARLEALYGTDFELSLEPSNLGGKLCRVVMPLSA